MQQSRLGLPFSLRKIIAYEVFGFQNEVAGVNNRCLTERFFPNRERQDIVKEDVHSSNA